MRLTHYFLAIGVLACAFWFAQTCQTLGQRFQFNTSNIYISLSRSSNNKLQYQIVKGNNILETVTFDNLDTTRELALVDANTYELVADGVVIKFKLVSHTVDGVHINVKRENLQQNSQHRDCIPLDVPNTHWFAGPEEKQQYWPVEKVVWSDYPILTKEDRSAAVTERYWLNSKGMFLYVDEATPLFVDQNSPGYENQLCLSAKSALPYDARVTNPEFSYHLFFGKNSRSAHMAAINNFLGMPTGHPDERMVQHPIWSTWALYSRDINETIIRDFAAKIRQYNFKDSQLEIDDDWEDCYGALTIRKSKFPNMKKLTDDLKAMGFRVTLWIHPFINKNCISIYNEAKSKGYLVLDHFGSADTKWWNSEKSEAVHLDFTKPEVQKWFTDRIKLLQTEHGIDSFKFDAGETSWVPEDPVLQGDNRLAPSQITISYVRTVAEFGPMIEVRSAWGTQDLPVFVRMLDKDTYWDWNNGLRTLITTLVQMNLQGYPFVLPDMIGGNGYNEPPSKELFIRWLQANVFMPTLQYSFVPWNFDEETIQISHNFTNLHSSYAPIIIQRFKLATETGEPVNAPLWWIAPEDKVAQSIYDQFVLGEDIISAPVIEQGAVKRDIYLPTGKWKDGNSEREYTGPIWIMDYSAPLDTLPYFTRVTSSR